MGLAAQAIDKLKAQNAALQQQLAAAQATAYDATDLVEVTSVLGATAPAQNVPSGSAPPNVPPGAATPNLPSGSPALNVPSGAATPNLPSGSAALNVPSGAATPNLPSGSAALNVPSGAAAMNVPSAAAVLAGAAVLGSSASAAAKWTSVNGNLADASGRTVYAYAGVGLPDASAWPPAGTYNGKPVYYFVGDTAPGTTTGSGVAGVWSTIPATAAQAAAAT